MLKSFDFVDPLLAHKIRNLQLQLQKAQESRQQMLNNKKVNASMREKLLKYQNECRQTIENMLAKQKDKLAEYLDEQTIAITKTNRSSTHKITKSQNMTLNQSTKIDLSLDQSKTLDATSKISINRKVSTFYLSPTPHNPQYGNKTALRIRRLKKQVADKDKIIKMLVSWIKIYHERQQTYRQQSGTHFQAQNAVLNQQNAQLRIKCNKLEEDIRHLRSQFKDSANSILRTHNKYEQIKCQNKKLQLQRKQLLSSARSLKKHSQLT